MKAEDGKEQAIVLRSVCDSDCDLLYEWVNDPSVRKNAFDSNRIEYVNHKRWFHEREQRSTLMYLALKEDIAVGQIRIDIDGDYGIIDYSVAAEYRGQGIGSLLLILVCDRVKRDDPSLKMIVGRVKNDNIASQKAFEKADYKKVDKLVYYEYQKIL